MPAPLCFWYLLCSDVLQVAKVSGENIGVQPMGVLQERAAELLRRVAGKDTSAK